jgi:hypothetical protein
MNKNIVIGILAVFSSISKLYAIVWRSEANRQRELAVEQKDVAVENRAEAIRQRAIAEEQARKVKNRCEFSKQMPEDQSDVLAWPAANNGPAPVILPTAQTMDGRRTDLSRRTSGIVEGPGRRRSIDLESLATFNDTYALKQGVRKSVDGAPAHDAKYTTRPRVVGCGGSALIKS